LEKEKFGEKILKEFGMKSKKQPNWAEWKNLVDNILAPKKKVKIAIVGKYIEIGDYALADSYLSINQSLLHAGASLSAAVEIDWLDSKKFEDDKKSISVLKNYDGVIVPGGFGSSGVEGKILAANYARVNKIPYLGLCYGLQLAVIEFARNVCGLKDAHTTEVSQKTPYPVIDVQPAQKEIIEKNMFGGTMRLGAYSAVMKEKTKILKLYEETGRLKDDAERIKELSKENLQAFRIGVIEKGKKAVLERHRHRYEVNPKYVDILEKNGMVFSGYYERFDKTRLMEYIELPNHPFFVGTQAHPEFKSRMGNPSPLFYGFVKACLK
jgi:CTP synthase